MDENKLREIYREDGWGKLAEAAGFDPIRTESSAREAFRFCHARIEALEAENARLRAALAPFSAMAGEMFARNWEKGRLAMALDNPGDPHRLLFDDFLSARATLQENTDAEK